MFLIQWKSPHQHLPDLHVLRVFCWRALPRKSKRKLGGDFMLVFDFQEATDAPGLQRAPSRCQPPEFENTS